MTGVLHDTVGSRPCSCDNCGWTGTEEDIEVPATFELDRGLYADSLHERLNAGCEVPVGECPKCGVFAYLDTPETRARSKAKDMMEILRAVAGMLSTPYATREAIKDLLVEIEGKRS